jgi:hypothetical protein
MDSIADLLATRPVVSEPGASGYFSAPSSHLDPNLFGGDRVNRQVRVLLLSTLYSYWRTRWSEPQAWSTVYLAGSGASFQWNADRSEDGEPGDLDVLIDIDWPLFYAHQNTDVSHLPPAMVAGVMDADLKSNLWPKTAELHIGRGVYEATFYVNPQPIASIQPYAAYNLSEDRWLVRPEPHPQHPQTADDYAAVQADRDRTDALVARHNEFTHQLHTHPVNSPEWVTARTVLDNVSVLSRELFDEIHGARSEAFSPQGTGYADQANFRWQAAKASGVIDNLKSMMLMPRELDVENAADFLTQRALQARQP